MRKGKSSLIILFVVFFNILFLSGCWDRRELDELFVAYAAGVDANKDSLDQLSFSLSGPSVEDKAKEPTISISSEGKSIEDAMINIQSKLYREVVLGHVQVLLIGEDTAKGGISVYLDAFDRNPDVRGTMLIGVTQGEAKEVISEAKLKQHPYIGIFLKLLMQGVYRESISHAVTMREFYRDLNIDGKDPCMSYLILSPAKDVIMDNHIAAFQDDRLKGILDRDESIAAMILMNKQKEGGMAINLPDAGTDEFHDSAAVDFDRSSCKITPVIESGQLKIRMDVNVVAELSEHTPSQRTLTTGALERQDRLFEKQLKKDIEETLAKLQEWQSDIVGIGEKVRTKYPDFFEKKKWRKDFARAEFDIHVTFQIKRVGTAS